MKAFCARRPLAASLLFALSDFPLILFGIKVLPALAPALPDTAIKLLVLLGQIALAAAWLTALGWWRAAGFNRPSAWRELRLYWLPVAMMLAFPVAVGVHPGNLAAIAPVALLALLIGFQEEAIYRGLIVRANLPSGALRAVLVSALLFGLIHAEGFLLRDPGFVLTQIVASALSGIGMAALRLRTNTIWPLVLLHAYNDTIQFLAVGGANYTHIPTSLIVLKLSMPLVVALYGLFLMRASWLPRRAAGPASAASAG